MNQAHLADPIRLALAESIAAAISDMGVPDTSVELVFSWIEQPPEAHMGDFAFPCFRFAKSLRKNPAVIATELAQKLASPWLKEVKTAGAFLNMFLAPSELAKTSLDLVQSGRFAEVFRGCEHETVMIEFSQPNTHKEFHVGHLRNVALGDSLCRILRYCGYPVIAANYPGDEGAHIAKCLWQVKRSGQPAPDAGRGEWLGTVYTAAVQALAEASPDDRVVYDQEVSQILANIESQSGSDYELWRETRDWSLASFYEIYRWLGVEFDEYFFESELSEASQSIVDEFLKTGVFVESDGAIGCDLNDIDLGFLLLRKRDGNTLYATKDLALARRKFDEFNVAKSVYVVGAEQKLHFQQVFAALKRMGFAAADQCQHLSYGLVVLPDGKMSSRAGTAIPLSTLRGSVGKELDSFLEKYQGEWTPEEIESTREKLCVGALKYGMLSTDPVKDVVFDLQQWLSFEGDTGPYLMYAYARTQSILAKAKDKGLAPNFDHADQLQDEHELALLRQMYDFNSCVLASCENSKPSTLTHFLFDLCKSFNRFYAACPILSADPSVATARLALTAGFASVLKQGLALLGMTTADRM